MRLSYKNAVESYNYQVVKYGELSLYLREQQELYNHCNDDQTKEYLISQIQRTELEIGLIFEEIQYLKITLFQKRD